MLKASANACLHWGAMLRGCWYTELMLVLESRYLAKAFRKPGINAQGKALSRRVIEDAGARPLLPTSALLVSIPIVHQAFQPPHTPAAWSSLGRRRRLRQVLCRL